METATPQERQEGSEAFEREKDSLYLLPLSIIPLQTQALHRARLIKNVQLRGVVEFFSDANTGSGLETRALQRARLIKNVQLRGVVEFFSDASTGSGQMEVDDLAAAFDWPEEPVHPDLARMRELGRLPSYDVYSLRILLRELDIKVENVENLKLSAQKSRELTAHMRVFTGPLIRQVYGDTDVSIQVFSDVINLFKQANVELARQKLEQLSQKLGLTLFEVPKFLEDFADIFLSLSYFRSYLDNLRPKVGGFIAGIEDIRNSHELRQNRSLMKTCDQMEQSFNDLTSQTTGRFESFDRITGDMWKNISAERFRRVETLITGYHTTIGGVLCALGAKMNAWEERFPRGSVGGLLKRANFIETDMRLGLENIRQFENSAPMMAQLD